jgi:hypothetical protein
VDHNYEESINITNRGGGVHSKSMSEIDREMCKNYKLQEMMQHNGL